ncbi:MAG: hypothetical protein A3I11_02415 [Elusimicrobia bacterium RIFCSPLOWO2_02_FULL_39_32]|nr:MAG: hypothetical protein A3B80_07300 [Elusimicrobia bacterium RIFCSPHIGHO2_02_FULL_39_36]OGR92231.1 MAG: hypothetical protein A3I11_02415 [Elusimicrobia bacterium RIFCSPLOWO2_02_FULL_39_32]
MFNQLKEMYELQKKAKEIQKKLENIFVEQSDNGITIKVNGLFKVDSLNIDSSYCALEKKEKLESLLKKLFTEAVQEVQKKSAMESKDLLKSFNL